MDKQSEACGITVDMSIAIQTPENNWPETAGVIFQCTGTVGAHPILAILGRYLSGNARLVRQLINVGGAASPRLWCALSRGCALVPGSAGLSDIYMNLPFISPNDMVACSSFTAMADQEIFHVST